MSNTFGELKDVIREAIEAGGRIVSHTGPLITGFLYFNGYSYPNEIFRIQAEFLGTVEAFDVPDDYDATRKYIWVLGQHGVVHNSTLELFEQGRLTKEDLLRRKKDGEIFRPPDFEDLTFRQLADRTFTRNFYTVDSAFMDWIDEPDDSIINSLRGFQSEEPEGPLAEFTRATAGIPAEILRPYAIEWDDSQAPGSELEQ